MKNQETYLSKRNFIHIVIPLTIGFLIYVLFHKPNLLLHSFINRFTIIQNYYEQIKGQSYCIFLLNHLPDALWIYSFGIFLFVTFDFIKNTFLKAAIIIILGSLTEIVQFCFSQGFTFDWLDLLINIIILLLICFKYEIKKEI